MIIKFKINTDKISAWGYEEADQVYVHKQFSNEIKGNHSFYETEKVQSLDAHANGKFPIMNKIVLIDVDRKEIRTIVIPVSGSEIYLLSNEGKTIERL